MYHFEQPLWGLLILLWPLQIWWQGRQAARQSRLHLSTAAGLAGKPGWRVLFRQRLSWLRYAALGLLVVAMMRPQKLWQEQKIEGEGIDIMLALDISPSMLSRDFEPDRLTVTKKVAIDFVKKRPNDRLGLVVFSAEAFTHCPLTPDKRVVQQFIQEVQVGVLEDGTAIGLGLATALNRLKSSTAKSKIIVLLTDGENNVPTVAPEDAAQLAREMGIKVYTIGVGKEGWVESPVSRFPDGSYAFDHRMSVVDTELLKKIAATTQGRFFRAYTPNDLAEIYAEIDRLEKTNMEITTLQRSTDYYRYWAGAALILLILEFLLRWGVFRSATP